MGANFEKEKEEGGYKGRDSAIKKEAGGSKKAPKLCQKGEVLLIGSPN